jgi:hypothetical protein
MSHIPYEWKILTSNIFMIVIRLFKCCNLFLEFDLNTFKVGKVHNQGKRSRNSTVIEWAVYEQLFFNTLQEMPEVGSLFVAKCVRATIKREILWQNNPINQSSDEIRKSSWKIRMLCRRSSGNHDSKRFRSRTMVPKGWYHGRQNAFVMQWPHIGRGMCMRSSPRLPERGCESKHEIRWLKLN